MLRAELGAKPGEFLVGGVGRLAASKGFDGFELEQAALPNEDIDEALLMERVE